ncbi:MAG: 1-acyl-sn-glycerol-3-phosphate acyltransferase [Candidatus Zixiibacteriota bacterium]|nr:MAG: 1-acyl-sn-glycerol-3-phosphate acyltransferase [candidate division Zixibacteria bacterium]
MRFSYRLVTLLARIPFLVLFRLKIVGLENVPRDGRLIIAANHQSYLDPPLIGSTMPREIHFMAKASLFEKPLLGPLIRHLNSIPVTRSGQDLASLRTAVRVLDSGGALLIFPEGTRSRSRQFLRATGGLGFLARQSGAPVLPVYIHGTRGALRRLFRPGAVTMVVGQPIPPDEFPPEAEAGSAAHRALSQYILDKIAELQSALKHT